MSVHLSDGSTAVAVRPRGPKEVAAAVAGAARDGLRVAVRAGGHGLIDHGADERCLLIDLADLDAFEVLDSSRRLVRVGAGATWGRVAAVLDRHGWALTAGDTASVGVGGLTLAGGIGWLVRKHGLAIDHLVAARVVTADGQLVIASEDVNPALFWALRGGGGNFGVVVDFDFVVQPVESVRFGSVTYRSDDPRGLVARWRDAMREAPDELSSTLVLAPSGADGPTTATVLLCHAPDVGGAEHGPGDPVFPLFDLGPVANWNLAERRCSEILETGPAHPPGLRPVVRNTLVRSLDDEVLTAIDRLHAGPAPVHIALRALGGAVARVPADATAFAHRDAEAMVLCAAMQPATASPAEAAAALGSWQDVAARGLGCYVGLHGSAGPDDLAAAYPTATRVRLSAVKRAYDPGNRFRHNLNVPPLVERPGARGGGA
ncbi:FAD/FMN-containing dehydrogenase [Nocardioides thalensis]|uniref:FAD/FMN-containing dehydrogenase n=1 Tax=Nocardioides thalensis TaxID=1914755 RepID=A0A853C6J1_9ACTN|nr:FAD-binding protein [Nocardioides thalensis]NYJ02636.1 FAD/FMN-containing dehydrogenase [Nocardioides thalensis]